MAHSHVDLPKRYCFEGSTIPLRPNESFLRDLLSISTLFDELTLGAKDPPRLNKLAEADQSVID